jgi:MFS family permease
MLGCDAVRALVQAAVAVALFSGVMEVWMFGVAGAVFGAAGAVFVPASSGLVPEVVSSGRLQEANALLGISRNAVRILGPVISGLLVAGVGSGVVFAIDSATFVVSAGFLFAMAVPDTARKTYTRFLTELGDGWGEVRSRSWLVGGMVSFALNNLVIASVFVLGPLIAQEQLDGATSWGLILGGGAIGGVVGSLAVFRVRPKRPLPTALGVRLLECAPFFTLALHPNTPASAAAMGMFGFAIAFFTPSGRPSCSERSQPIVSRE